MTVASAGPSRGRPFLSGLSHDTDFVVNQGVIPMSRQQDGADLPASVPPATGDGPPACRGVAAVVMLVRPHQWVKNGFVLAPLFFSPALLSVDTALVALAATVCFCLMASGVYVLNDLLDRSADRLHPTKRFRPLAAGTVSPAVARMLIAGFAVAGLAGAAVVSLPFLAVLAAYAAINILYSAWLKRLAILDVMVVALGFVLRLEAGALVIAVEATAWIVVCGGLLALFLALAKRRDDLVQTLDARHRPSLAGYNLAFVDSALTMVMAALLVTYSLYTTSAAAMANLGSDRLYLTIPFVLAGLLRYLQIALVDQRSGSPTRIALTDPFTIGCVTGWLMTFGGLIYL